jgi:lysophospholipase L1-like esterase
VFNAGVGGEKVVGSQAKDRLLVALNTYQPNVLLLLHGVNNVNAAEDSLSSIVEAIEELIELAHGRGVHVILGNLPPQIPTTKATGGARIGQFNSQLPAVAAEEGATLVDVFSNFSTSLLMPDGLHLTEAGNQKLAELFYDAIKARYHKEPGQ